MELSARAAGRPTAMEKARDGLLRLRVDGLVPQVALGVGVVIVVTIFGWGLRQISPGVLPSALFFPAVLVASLIGGWRAGLTCGVLALIARTFTLRPDGRFAFETPASALANFTLFGIACAALVAVGAYARFLHDDLKRSRDALNERSLLYATLFKTIPEGFAICDGIRDGEGRLSDYTIVEINPALQRTLGVGQEATGTRLTDARGDWTAWLQLCDRVLLTGEPLRFERYNGATKHWHEVHLSRVSPDRMAQFFIDITARKQNETRQAELFDELNHRVKNNLGMVASLLQLQARGARPEVRAELSKASARVQSIAEVHGALSRDTGTGSVDFGAYLHDLCASLKRSLTLDEGVTLKVTADEARVPVETAVPLGMVVNELVTNAVKYAAADGIGSIEVTFRRDSQLMSLSVRDRGPGLPPDDSIAEGRLGMRLVRSLVAQVGGDLTIRSDGGASFEIRLANDPESRRARERSDVA